MSRLSIVFIVLALAMSHWMFAVVAYNYCNMLWMIDYMGYSAPANTAFVLALPHISGILICLLLAFVFRRKK